MKGSPDFPTNQISIFHSFVIFHWSLFVMCNSHQWSMTEVFSHRNQQNGKWKIENGKFRSPYFPFPPVYSFRSRESLSGGKVTVQSVPGARPSGWRIRASRFRPFASNLRLEVAPAKLISRMRARSKFSAFSGIAFTITCSGRMARKHGLLRGNSSSC